MIEPYIPLLITLGMAAALAAVILLLAAFLGPSRPSAVKSEVFESGNPSSGPAREPFNVKFYLVAILFLVFDIEAVFIYPWAVVFRDATLGKGALSPVVAAIEMFVFIGFVVVALVYAWRKGALEWGS